MLNAMYMYVKMLSNMIYVVYNNTSVKHHKYQKKIKLENIHTTWAYVTFLDFLTNFEQVFTCIKKRIVNLKENCLFFKNI